MSAEQVKDHRVNKKLKHEHLLRRYLDEQQKKIDKLKKKSNGK